MSLLPCGPLGEELPEISNSLRFDGSNDYLTRTQTGTGAASGTHSAWVKLGKISTYTPVFSYYWTANDYLIVFVDANGNFGVQEVRSGATRVNKRSSAVLRDPSAWYHLMFCFDTSLATAEDRFQLWVQGVRVTAWTLNTNTFPQGGTTAIADANYAQRIGSEQTAPSYADGYIAYPCVIQGSQLTPSSFAYTDPNGQWRSLSKGALTALASAGGTNSFFLPFDDGASTTTLGNDVSSKNNDWTLNGPMYRDGSVNDCWSYDTPTNNFATLNPLQKRWAVASEVYSNGALTVTNSGASNDYGFGTVVQPSGKWYWEATVLSVGTGVMSIGVDSGLLQSSTTTDLVFYNKDGTKSVAGTGSAYGATYTTNNVIGVALDRDGGTVTFYKDGVSQGALTLPTSAALGFACSPDTGATGSVAVNFGQRPVSSGAWDSASGGYFRYTPPAGFKALCTKNLPVPTGAAKEPSKHFDVKTWAGNSSSQNITLQFQPDFVWIKNRSSALYDNNLHDYLRAGGINTLYSNLTNAEVTDTAQVSSLNSNGYSLGSSSQTNGSTFNYVGWSWKGAGAGYVTNNAGSISSQVSANTSAGFSIVTYTGTGANATVGHGLGVAPKFIITKVRGAISGWYSYHASLGANSVITLNTTNAVGTSTTYWNNTSPSSTVFSLGTDPNNNPVNTCVAYCFAEVAGFSKIGSYTGNGSADGPFVWCGFRPKFVMVKDSVTAAQNWFVFDSTRDTYNQMPDYLSPNVASAESALGSGGIDFTANGFKLRTTSTGINNSAAYIFVAFAEAPFQYANAR